VALTFTLNGQPFDGTPDAYGVQWFATVTGWDGPPLTASLTARPGDHGSLRGPSYYNTRAMTMTGIAKCPNVTEVRRAKDRLDTIVPIGVDLNLTSAEDRTSVVQLAGALLKNAINEQTLTFSIPLEAADPWKYGPQQFATVPLGSDVLGTGYQLFFPLRLFTTNGLTVVNDGTQIARPILTYWGPCTGPYSTNNDLGITDGYDITLPTAADFLVVDHDFGSVLLNGSAPRRTTRVPTYRPWPLDKQSAQTITAGAASSSAGARVEMTWYPTYV
jgi:hypothetical protein